MSDQLVKLSVSDSKQHENKHENKHKHKNKQANKQINTQMPVFRIKLKEPRINQCKIKLAGIINENDKLGDEVVELDKPLHKDYHAVGKNAIPIRDINGYNILGRLYICNIVGSHIVSSSRYPIMYLTIEYQKTIVTGSLLQLIFSIDMEKEQKKAITAPDQYVNLSFTGNFVSHIECDDEFKNNYEKYVKEMLESEALNIFYHSEDPDIIEKRKTLTELEILEWVDQYVKNEKIEYDKIMYEQTNLTVKNITVLRDSFIKLCMSDRFYKFLELAMKGRELHRKAKYGIEDNSNEYIVPKTVTKLDDIKQKMVDNDELVLDDDN